jgi:TonB family protein
MGWISIFLDYRHWQLVGGKSATASNTTAGASVRVICLAASLLSMITLFPALMSVHAEESGNERKLIARVEPEYPETLQRLYIGGVVRLELTIAAKGQVEKVTLLGGNPILGQSAMAAAKKWKYEPANSRTVIEVKIPFDPHR